MHISIDFVPTVLSYRLFSFVLFYTEKLQSLLWLHKATHFMPYVVHVIDLLDHALPMNLFEGLLTVMS